MVLNTDIDIMYDTVSENDVNNGDVYVTPDVEDSVSDDSLYTDIYELVSSLSVESETIDYSSDLQVITFLLSVIIGMFGCYVIFRKVF